MLQLRIDIQADAVKRHPMAQPDADGGDLVFAPVAVRDPDADAFPPALALDVESRQCADQPFLQSVYERSHVGFATVEVEHHICHPLPGPVIGVLAAAAALKDRKARRDQIAILGAGPAPIDRRALPPPPPFPPPPPLA